MAPYYMPLVVTLLADHLRPVDHDVDPALGAGKLTMKPTIALAMGDPAGISPELTAKVVALPEVRDAMRLVVIGDARVFDAGAKLAGVAPGLRADRGEGRDSAGRQARVRRPASPRPGDGRARRADARRRRVRARELPARARAREARRGRRR